MSNHFNALVRRYSQFDFANISLNLAADHLKVIADACLINREKNVMYGSISSSSSSAVTTSSAAQLRASAEPAIRILSDMSIKALPHYLEHLSKRTKPVAETEYALILRLIGLISSTTDMHSKKYADLNRKLYHMALAQQHPAVTSLTAVVCCRQLSPDEILRLARHTVAFMNEELMSERKAMRAWSKDILLISSKFRSPVVYRAINKEFNFFAHQVFRESRDRFWKELNRTSVFSSSSNDNNSRNENYSAQRRRIRTSCETAVDILIEVVPLLTCASDTELILEMVTIIRECISRFGVEFSSIDNPLQLLQSQYQLVTAAASSSTSSTDIDSGNKNEENSEKKIDDAPSYGGGTTTYNNSNSNNNNNSNNNDNNKQQLRQHVLAVSNPETYSVFHDTLMALSVQLSWWLEPPFRNTSADQLIYGKLSRTNPQKISMVRSILMSTWLDVVETFVHEIENARSKMLLTIVHVINRWSNCVPVFKNPLIVRAIDFVESFVIPLIEDKRASSVAVLYTVPHLIDCAEVRLRREVSEKIVKIFLRHLKQLAETENEKKEKKQQQQKDKTENEIDENEIEIDDKHEQEEVRGKKKKATTTTTIETSNYWLTQNPNRDKKVSRSRIGSHDNIRTLHKIIKHALVDAETLQEISRVIGSCLDIEDNADLEFFAIKIPLQLSFFENKLLFPIIKVLVEDYLIDEKKFPSASVDAQMIGHYTMLVARYAHYTNKIDVFRTFVKRRVLEQCPAPITPGSVMLIVSALEQLYQYQGATIPTTSTIVGKDSSNDNKQQQAQQQKQNFEQEEQEEILERSDFSLLFNKLEHSLQTQRGQLLMEMQNLRFFLASFPCSLPSMARELDELPASMIRPRIKQLINEAAISYAAIPDSLISPTTSSSTSSSFVVERQESGSSTANNNNNNNNNKRDMNLSSSNNINTTTATTLVGTGEDFHKTEQQVEETTLRIRQNRHNAKFNHLHEMIVDCFCDFFNRDPQRMTSSSSTSSSSVSSSCENKAEGGENNKNTKNILDGDDENNILRLVPDCGFAKGPSMPQRVETSQEYETFVAFRFVSAITDIDGSPLRKRCEKAIFKYITKCLYPLSTLPLPTLLDIVADQCQSMISKFERRRQILYDELFVIRNENLSLQSTKQKEKKQQEEKQQQHEEENENENNNNNSGTTTTAATTTAVEGKRRTPLAFDPEISFTISQLYSVKRMDLPMRVIMNLLQHILKLHKKQQKQQEKENDVEDNNNKKQEFFGVDHVVIVPRNSLSDLIRLITFCMHFSVSLDAEFNWDYNNSAFNSDNKYFVAAAVSSSNENNENNGDNDNTNGQETQKQQQKEILLEERSKLGITHLLQIITQLVDYYPLIKQNEYITRAAPRFARFLRMRLYSDEEVGEILKNLFGITDSSSILPFHSRDFNDEFIAAKNASYSSSHYYSADNSGGNSETNWTRRSNYNNSYNTKSNNSSNSNSKFSKSFGPKWSSGKTSVFSKNYSSSERNFDETLLQSKGEDIWVEAAKDAGMLNKEK